MTTTARRGVRPGLVFAAAAVGLVLLLFGLFGCSVKQTPIDADPSATPTAASDPPSEDPPPSAEPDPTPTKAPQPTQAAKPKPTAKPLTASQENAIDTAGSYLDGSAFSRKGLIEQVEYEGYPNSDAKFAVAWLERHHLVDWNAEAAEAAKSYLDGSSFSRKGLIEQLEYEGFTRDQAVYGVNKAGL